MNKTNKIIYLYIFGIVILIVAIIGMTYAYFTASSSNSNISGGTAKLELELNIYPKSDGIENPLIPQKKSSIGSAVIGNENGSCVDNNGNTVCQVYEIVVENKGETDLILNGTMTLVADTIDDLRWGLGTGVKEGFSENKTYDKLKTDLIDPVTDELQSITLQKKDNIVGSGDDTAKFYVVIFLEEKDQNQTGTNIGEFHGEVEFYAVNGEGGVKATFTS